ncbi:hypothetical protein H8M03_06320 [Sphingomonas sabuli]|uniref:Uncharacterized protein n=1 Tax=Sphingomonas sabuli TaxID=2764186 RepID=A0A7G9KZ93_9SPHN|nr:hypothetical protein [Sphingomonas sabuli]QNM81692.1 hypothetical protein H8M03_06320 [Sphingomonas sabuli]
MKTLLTILGAIAIAMGLLWIGQGLGVIDWPQSSFMIDQSVWAVYGALLTVAGIVLVIWTRRRP